MSKVTINNFHIFTIIFFLNNASVLVFGLHKDLMQDGILGILISFIFISIVLIIYILLVNKNKDMGLAEIIESNLGKTFGRILIVIYSAYFIYIAFRVFEDLYYLIHLTLLDDTPKWFIYTSLIIILIYSVNKGVETIGRTTVVMFLMLMFSTVLILITGIFNIENFDNLFPILENGWDPIIKWSRIQFTVLFGEVVVILVYFSNVYNTKKSIRIVYYTLIINTLFMMMIITLGYLLVDPVITKRSIYPITLFGQMLHLTFIDKVDTLIYYQIFYVSLIKILVLYFAASSLTQSALKKANKLYINIFLGFIILMFALFNNQSITEHFNTGLKFVPTYIHIPLQIGVPFILLIISLFKKKNVEISDIDDSEIVIKKG